MRSVFPLTLGGGGVSLSQYEIDKKLGIRNSDDVEAMGIAAYNEECRSIVTTYTGEWETVVNRLGRWIDFKNDYKTMEPWFMESVWWVFKTIFDKGLVYRSYKVMPYSTACNTPLSNFEAGLDYRDVTDPAVVVNFPLVDEPDVSDLLFAAFATAAAAAAAAAVAVAFVSQEMHLCIGMKWCGVVYCQC